MGIPALRIGGFSCAERESTKYRIYEIINRRHSPQIGHTMAYQRGSLKKLRRKEGEIWVLRYRITKPDGRRVENTLPIGLVRNFPKEWDAWREADRLDLHTRINEESRDVRIHFDALAEQHLRNDFGADAVRPKTERTVLNTEHIVCTYLIPRWGDEIAGEIKPLEIQRWLKSLHGEKGLA